MKSVITASDISERAAYGYTKERRITIHPCARVIVYGNSCSCVPYVPQTNKEAGILQFRGLKMVFKGGYEMDKMAESGQIGTKDGHIGRDFRVGT